MSFIIPSFKQFLYEHQFISCMADQYFDTILTENFNNLHERKIYYTKDNQMIYMSDHGIQDNLKRFWWDHDTHTKDPKFTTFADKALWRIKNKKDLLKKDKDGIERPKIELDTHIGFIDSSRKRGWVTAVQNPNLESLYIVTVFNMDVNMNKKLPMFVKPTYKIDIDGPLQTELYKTELEQIENDIKANEEDYEYAKLEIEEYPDDEEIRKKFKALHDNMTRWNNRKNNLMKTLSESKVYIVTNESGKKLRILMI